MKYVAKSTNQEFLALMERRSTKKGAFLCRIKKDGTPGKATYYEYYGAEKTPEDAIARLQKLNPGNRWILA